LGSSISEARLGATFLPLETYYLLKLKVRRKGGTMLLRFNEDPRIEDLRNHPADSVETLRTLLRAGVLARPDPRRRDFYEVNDRGRVFYIHITPRGRVLLLAIWSKDTSEPQIEAGSLAAASPCSQKEALAQGF
jgi:hypothetical protein